VTLRIITSVVLGGGIGLAVGLAFKSAGGQCPLLCNPYISTGLGVFIALLLASRSQTVPGLDASENLIQVASAQQYDALIGSEGPVLVAFYTSHCPACHRQMPDLARLADDKVGRARVAVVNARKLSGVAARENIKAVPTLLLYRAGQLEKRIEGLTGAKDLAKMLDELPSLPRDQARQDG
jgi:thioredoxin 1